MCQALGCAFCMDCCCCSASKGCPVLVTWWIGARWAPLSMGFLRQGYWRLPFPSPGDLPDPGIDPVSLESPTLAGGLFTTETPGTPFKLMIQFYCYPHCMDEHAEAQTGDIPCSRSWSSSYAVALGFTQVCILTTHLWGFPVLWRTFQCMLTSWHYLTHHADFSSTSQLVFSNQIIYRVLILGLVRRLQDRIKQSPH